MAPRHARPRASLLTLVLRPRGRHQAPSEAFERTGLALATAGLAGGFAATFATPAAAHGGSRHGATAADFRRLAQCESGGNYAINTGNGFFGAYQFDRRTWQGLGYSGTANQHPPSVQDTAAWRLQQSRGWQPWPGCTRKLGLRDRPELAGINPFAAQASRSRPAAPAPKKAPAPKAAPQKVAPRLAPVPANVPRPAFRVTLTPAMVGKYREDVRIWQARMRARGWRIAVDGYFGPQSASVARRFQLQKGVGAHLGHVDRATWDAAWTLPTR